jgi:DNA (cytosine-5)-methyltransferase 1
MQISNSESIGATIRKLREERQFSLNSVAQELNIDTSLLSKIERGERNATKEQITKLSEVFRIESSYLLIPYLSRIVYEEIATEDCAEEVLKLAEDKIKSEGTGIKEEKLKVIDLFSGCGGFSYGFENAGYQVVLGVDNNAVALETFKANHKNSQILCGDLHNDQVIEEIVHKVKGVKIDVIIAGPPCQGFSLTGSRQENDDRNKLFYAVFKLAKKIKPRAVIIENVPGLAALYDGQAKRAIEEQFKKLNFSLNNKVLFAPDFEVPQIRKRIFFVGLSNNKQTFEFPLPVLSPSDYNTCSIAIGDLPERATEYGNEQDKYDKSAVTEYQKRMRNGNKILYNHVSSKHTEMVINVIKQVPEGGNHKDLPPGVGESRKFNEAWTRYHGNKPSKTIDTGHRNHFHYKLNRIPTVRENARLQSFPDSFVFAGNKTQQYKQVGNAVPPLLGFHVAKKLVEYLKK